MVLLNTDCFVGVVTGIDWSDVTTVHFDTPVPARWSTYSADIRFSDVRFSRGQILLDLDEFPVVGDRVLVQYGDGRMHGRRIALTRNMPYIVAVQGESE